MYKHWAYNPTRKQYVGTYEVAEHLPPGLYSLGITSFGDPAVTALLLRQDTMLAFEHGPLHGVISEIDKFWGSAAHYARLGVSHKRGILLYGPPGCGKTGIISVIIETTIARNGIVFQVNDIEDFQRGILLARQIENNRPIVAIIEDIEHVIDRDEEILLEAMDGASSTGDGILFVATTNHLQRIPPRVRCRPSRIDTLIEIGYPNREQRYEYFKFLLYKEDSKTSQDLAKQLAGETNDFSLAMLKELVISIQVYGKSVSQAIKTLKEMADSKDSSE